MKILLIHNYFHIIGGAEVHFFALSKLLREKGHQVLFFSMASPQNYSTEFSKYFVPFFPRLDNIPLLNKIKLFSSSLYSFDARRRLRQLIIGHRPDIVHVHNVWYEITHSILHEIKRFNIPVLLTLHDYRFICPNHKLLTNNGLCFRCNARKYYQVLLNNCFGSFERNFFVMMFSYINNVFLRTYKLIDAFVSPSQFLISKMKECRLFKGSIFYHLPNFLEADQNLGENSASSDNSIVYFGRIDIEKGIDTLIEAVSGLNVQLKIIGTGPKEMDYRKLVQEKKIRNIHFMGFLSRKEALNEVSRSLFTIVPSRWQENFPYAIIESFMLGKPVIASKIGGIPELVEDGETGQTFEPGGVNDLRDKISSLINDKLRLNELGLNAKKWVSQNLDKENFYNSLLEIYKELINKYKYSLKS